MEQGTILAGVGGNYEVQTERGLINCTLRGRLRLSNERILVGDRVMVSSADGNGVVETVLPRTNVLKRPPIANVNQILAVFSIQSPKPNLVLLDRILVQAELVNLPSIIVLNKADLDLKHAEELGKLYANIPYPIIISSTKTKLGLDNLLAVLQNKISCFVGPSGVGKSSLLNSLQPDLNLETQKVSVRTQRGRHTTRTVQLLPIANGYVADTPGFSHLRFEPEQQIKIGSAFPEIHKLASNCRFRGCQHWQEPGCAVKEAVSIDQIATHRYEHYLLFLTETKPQY